MSVAGYARREANEERRTGRSPVCTLLLQPPPWLPPALSGGSYSCPHAELHAELHAAVERNGVLRRRPSARRARRGVGSGLKQRAYALHVAGAGGGMHAAEAVGLALVRIGARIQQLANARGLTVQGSIHKWRPTVLVGARRRGGRGKQARHASRMALDGRDHECGQSLAASSIKLR